MYHMEQLDEYLISATDNSVHCKEKPKPRLKPTQPQTQSIQTHPLQETRRFGIKKNKTPVQERFEYKNQSTIENVFYLASVVPMVILTWIQFALNVFILMGLSFGAWKTGCILAADLDKHLDKQAHIMLTDIVQCSRDYIRNGCGRLDTPPRIRAQDSNMLENMTVPTSTEAEQ